MSNKDHRDEVDRAPDPIPFRFPLKRKVPVPQCVGIDEAIDLLGRRLFPAEWGMEEAWKEAPFLYRKKDHSYVRYSLCRDDDSTWYREKESFDSGFPAPTMTRIQELCRKVRRTLRDALATGKVQASRMYDSGRVEALTDYPGIWATKMRSIFFTGHAFEGKDKFRILVHHASLERWLTTDVARATSHAITPKSSRNPSDSMLAKLADSICSRMRGCAYRAPKDALYDLIRDTLATEDYDLSKKRFIKKIWSGCPGAGKSGKRSDVEHDRFRDDRPHLQGLIRTHIRACDLATE